VMLGWKRRKRRTKTDTPENADYRHYEATKLVQREYS